MTEIAGYARWYATWLWWWACDITRETWESIPGPRPVKITVMAVLALCLLIPGPLDELGVILAIRGLAWLRRRRTARAVTS